MQAKSHVGTVRPLRFGWYLYRPIGNGGTLYRRLNRSGHTALGGVSQLLSPEAFLKKEANDDTGLAVDGLNHLSDIRFVTFEPLVDTHFKLVTAPLELLKSQQTPAPPLRVCWTALT